MSGANLQRLELADELFPDLMSGKKTDTLRWNEGTFELGYLEFYSKKDISRRATVLVTGIRKGTLSSFARHYGQSVELLLLRMQKHYPDITLNDGVTLVEFMSPSDTEALTA